MTEPQLYELLGRKQALLETATESYLKALAVLRGLKNGDISIDRLTINEDGTWRVSPQS